MPQPVPICRHLHPGGRRCHSPALRGRDRCYFHLRRSSPIAPRRPTTRPGYRWVALQRRTHLLDRHGIQQAATEIANAVIQGKITDRRVWKLLVRLYNRITLLDCEAELRP